MRERKWYSRFGIEPPFPWDALMWPLVWVFCVVAEAYQKRRFQ